MCRRACRSFRSPRGSKTRRCCGRRRLCWTLSAAAAGWRRCPGPNIAAELARYLPATAVAASEDGDLAKRIQNVFSTQWFRVYTNTDVIGTELAGATKNVIAIAAGILDGLAAGNNAKAALVTRGLVEITRLGVAMGAQESTFQGLAGLGDLITTCVSPEGRNRTVGEQIGKGRKLQDILGSMDSVAEGVPTTRSVRELSIRYNVEMPITESVHAVSFRGDGCDPRPDGADDARGEAGVRRDYRSAKEALRRQRQIGQLGAD